MTTSDQGSGSRAHVDGDRGALRLVCQRLEHAGWTLVDGDPCDLRWSVQAPLGGGHDLRLAPGGALRTNHLSGIACLARKDQLWNTLEAHRQLLARRGVTVEQFQPETFLMPEDWARYHARAGTDPSAVWIQKPRAAARGEGITILVDPHQPEAGGNWLVQRYIDDPHLLDGRKYTMRWYVLLTGLAPLEAFVFDDGFVKLAGRPYEGAPAGDRFAHLTNPDIQALDPDAVVSADNLTFGAYRERLREDGADPESIFSAIRHMLAFCVVAARERLLRERWKRGFASGGEFELLGCDILLDSRLTPWLLEANMSPSLEVEAGPGRASLEEAALKRRLVDSVLAVCGLWPDRSSFPSDVGFAPLVPGQGQAGWVTLPRPGEPAHRAARLGIPPGVVSWPLGDGLVLRSPRSGELHLLDTPASYMWSALEEGLTPEEVVDELSESIPEAAWRVPADFWNTVAAWVEQGLLEMATPDPSVSEPLAPPTDLESLGPVGPTFVWNPGAVYQLGGVAVHVTAPSIDAAGWIDAAMQTWRAEQATPAGSIRVTGRDGAWLVEWAGGRAPCASARQLGPLVRHAMAETVAPSMQRLMARATLLGDADGAALITGPVGIRAGLIQAWTGAGGTCYGDDYLQWTGEGFLGSSVGMESHWEGDWYGPMPDWLEGESLHVAPFGRIIRYRWFPVESTETRPVCLVHLLDVPSGEVLLPAPSNASDALADLLSVGAAPTRQVPAEDLSTLLQVVSGARCYRAAVGRPGASVEVIRRLLSQDPGPPEGFPPR